MAFNDPTLTPFMSSSDAPRIPPEMQNVLDQVLQFAKNTSRLQAPTAGRAYEAALGAVGGVYGHNLAHQDASSANEVNKGKLDLETKTSPALLKESQAGNDILKKIKEANLVGNKAGEKGVPGIGNNPALASTFPNNPAVKPKTDIHWNTLNDLMGGQ